MQRSIQPPPVAPPSLKIAPQGGTAGADVQIAFGLPEGVDTKSYAIEVAY